ncbi:hypothetical protein P8W02_26655, partial [Klebsiella pneumoniae]|nr:hypothetical protein [Klebsiella pneumoniae]
NMMISYQELVRTFPNPRGLENDLNKSEDDFEIVTLIVPKGY